MGEDKRGQGNNFLFSTEIWLYVVNGFKQSTVYDLHQFTSFWNHSLKWTLALLLLFFCFVWHGLLFLIIFQITLCYCLDYSSKLTLLWPNVDNWMGFQGGSVVKNLPAIATGDAGLIPGSGRSPGGGDRNPLQYSCLENPMDKGAWHAAVHGVSKSQTQRVTDLEKNENFYLGFPSKHRGVTSLAELWEHPDAIQ